MLSRVLGRVPAHEGAGGGPWGLKEAEVESQNPILLALGHFKFERNVNLVIFWH